MRHDWNILATSQSGHQHALLACLESLGDFEPSPSRDVVVGVVSERYMFLDTVAARLHRDQRLPASLGRIIPVDRTVTLSEEDPTHSLEALVAEMAPLIGSRTYHVRLDLHGHSELHGQQLQARLADVAWDVLSAAGPRPTVNFEDPDVVLQVEVVGDTAGAVLVDRRLRELYPFLLVR